MNVLRKKYLFYIFLFSYGVRLIWWVFIVGHPERAFEPDSFGYIQLAESLRDSHTFPSIFRTPGYPFFIALIYSISGKFPQAVLIFQYFLDSLTALLVVLIFFRIFRKPVYSYIAGILYALNPFTVFYSNLILTETLFTFILATAVYFFILFLQDYQRKYLILSSFLLGLCTLCRPISLYLPLLLIPFILTIGYRIKDKIINVLIFLMIFYIILLPWYVRNYHKYDYWTLATVKDFNIFYYEAPAILMYRSNPFLKIQFGMDKILAEYQENIWFKARAKYGWDNKRPFEIHNDPEKVIILKKEGFKVIQQNPLSFSVIHLNGIGRILFPFYPHFEIFLGNDFKIIKIVCFSMDFIIMGFSLLGVILTLKRNPDIRFNRVITVSMIVLIFYFTFLPGVTGYNRFRLPVLPFISIFSSFGLMEILKLFNLRKKRSIESLDRFL
jgi:4-amino-4-deoxy-L-arabinose transferase-like glycosyltransferase